MATSAKQLLPPPSPSVSNRSARSLGRHHSSTDSFGGGSTGSNNNNNNNSNNNNSGSKQKKTKVEKICELQADLKVAREENRKLRKDLANSRREDADGDNGTNRQNYHPDIENVEKMKNAVKALRNVAIRQEMSLNAMRERAQQRRNEILQKEQQIAQLLEHIAALASDKGQEALATLQEQFLELQKENWKQQETIQQQKQKIEALENQNKETSSSSTNNRSSRNHHHHHHNSHGGRHRDGGSHRQSGRAVHRSRSLNGPLGGAGSLKLLHSASNSSNEGLMMSPISSSASTGGYSVKSVESSTTQTEFDAVRLKQMVADKDSRIVELEMKMESMKDQIHQARVQNNSSSSNQQTKTSTFDTGFDMNGDSDFGFSAFGTGDGNSNTRHKSSKSQPQPQEEPFFPSIWKDSSLMENDDDDLFDDDDEDNGKNEEDVDFW